MVLGTFEIAPQEVVITWADTAADDPARVVVLTEAFSFSGVLPDGVEDLDPFIAASELTLTQEIEGDPGAMVPGASVTRAITVKVAGVSPMFLPDLLLPFEVSGVAAYPDKPTLIETDNRGALGGTRRESVSYVAESGGAGTLPEIELPWFDIDTGTIEMARAEAVDISVDGPPAALADLEVSRRTAFLAAAGVVLAVLLAVGLRVVLRVLRRRTAKRREARLASEDHAWRSLMLAVAQHDHAALYPALDTWAERVNGVDPRLVSEVQAALVTLWRGRYGADSGSKAHPNKAWRNLGDTLRSARKPPPSKALHNTLLPLNPGASA
jgi:hypothetical protein